MISAALLGVFAATASISKAGEYQGQFGGEWYAEAQSRINLHRKADISITVTHGDAPVPGAHVRLEMTRHAFPFGSAVVAQRIANDATPDGARYREMITQLFNRVVFENDMKWPAWDGHWGGAFSRTQTMAAIEWLQARGIDIRGHCLVWPGWKHLPEPLKQFEHEPERLRAELLHHIRDVAGTFRDNIAEWDVVNETYWNRDLQDTLGRESMLDWFRAARDADPGAKLFINDARIISFYDVETEEEHKAFYYDEVAWLLSQGAPLDGIGFQCHFREDSLTPPEAALEMLDRFASFGIPLGITEFDIHTEDEELQARYLFDFLHIMFSHPSVTSFVMWGFWEGQIYKEPRALFRKDWTTKPGGQMFMDLVHRKWWTRASGLTDDQGQFRTRGFQGDYQLHIELGGLSFARRLTLPKAGVNLNIELDQTDVD